MSIKTSLSLAVLALLVTANLASSHSTTMFLETAFYKTTTEQIEMVMLKESHMHFVVVVLAVSAMVFLYSKTYFGNKNESNKDYFFFFNLLMFSLSMVILIMANNIILVMLGWDGLGVSSFLLITYYSTPLAGNSALATFSLNRVGDMFLMAALIFILNLGNSPTMDATFSGQVSPTTKMILCCSFIVGCMTKSAQIPFSSWLPAAMAAPTPVSSLVHSSTLVTAGIYLMLKMQHISAAYTQMAWAVMVLACLLSLLAGLFAILEKDVKKMVAMSTLSQLGILMFNLSLGSSLITMFHLLSHAFFKSILFMMSGMLILASMATQDLRKIASNKFNSTMILVTIFSSVLNLSGFPFLSGFFSKDSIILEEYLLGVNTSIKMVFLAACCASVGYSAKMVWYFVCQMFSGSVSSVGPNKALLILPTLMLVLASTVIGKAYIMGYMHKESYKMYNLEKKLGMGIILVALLMAVLAPKYSLGKETGAKAVLTQMLNLKFVGTTIMSRMATKMDLVLLSEKVIWTQMINYTTNMVSHLKEITSSIKMIGAALLTVLLIVAST